MQAGGAEVGGISTDDDLKKAIEVHLRANKNLDEKVARAIADSYEVVMRLEIERAKKKSR